VGFRSQVENVFVFICKCEVYQLLRGLFEGEEAGDFLGPYPVAARLQLAGYS
jgi:hypothetical protein